MTKFYYGTASIIALAFCHTPILLHFGATLLTIGFFIFLFTTGVALQVVGLRHFYKERIRIDQ